MLTISDLKAIQKYIKISAIAREANIDENTMTAKIRNGRELSVTESANIENILRKAGIVIDTDVIRKT